MLNTVESNDDAVYLTRNLKEESDVYVQGSRGKECARESNEAGCEYGRLADHCKWTVEIV